MKTNDFEMTIVKRGGTYIIALTPNPDTPPERVKQVAREILFQMLDVMDMMFPDPIEWPINPHGKD